MSLLFRLVLSCILLVLALFASFVAIKGSQPVGALGTKDSNPPVDIADLNYWQFMADHLHASSQTPANCHRTRLIYLAIALPVYPALYTYTGLFPESVLASHIQPNPLHPGKIGWREAPNIWWRLVVEFSWLAFTQPQWEFTPVVGNKVGVDDMCVLQEIK